MLFFIKDLSTGDVIHVERDFNTAQALVVAKREFALVDRHDLSTMEEAEALASAATRYGALFTPAREFLPTQTFGRSPEFDVIEAPRVGDKVSMAFNGDSYPAGRIAKISDSFRRIETDEGTVFWRRRQSGAWVSDRTWSMVAGHVERRNPSF